MLTYILLVSLCQQGTLVDFGGAGQAANLVWLSLIFSGLIGRAHQSKHTYGVVATLAQPLWAFNKMMRLNRLPSRSPRVKALAARRRLQPITFSKNLSKVPENTRFIKPLGTMPNARQHRQTKRATGRFALGNGEDSTSCSRECLVASKRLRASSPR